MKKGQVLLLVFFLLLIASLLGGGLALLWKAELQSRSLTDYNLKAFYLAQAGIERGKVFAANNHSSFGWRPCSNDNNPACWYRELNGGWYKFRVISLGFIALIYSKGAAVDPNTNEILAQRRIQMMVDTTHMTPIFWGWQEI